MATFDESAVFEFCESIFTELDTKDGGYYHQNMIHMFFPLLPSILEYQRAKLTVFIELSASRQQIMKWRKSIDCLRYFDNE